MFKTKLEMQKVWGDIPGDVFEFRYKKYEEKWKQNLKLVMEERQEIINERKKNPKEKELEEVKKKEKEKLDKAKEQHWKEIEAYLEF